MKKGKCVTLSNGNKYILVDSVNYKDCKYFAATPSDDNVSDVVFFRLLYDDNNNEYLEEINHDDYRDVIDALINHIMAMSNK